MVAIPDPGYLQQIVEEVFNSHDELKGKITHLEVRRDRYLPYGYEFQVVTTDKQVYATKVDFDSILMRQGQYGDQAIYAELYHQTEQIARKIVYEIGPACELCKVQKLSDIPHRMEINPRYLRPGGPPWEVWALWKPEDLYEKVYDPCPFCEESMRRFTGENDIYCPELALWEAP